MVHNFNVYYCHWSKNLSELFFFFLQQDRTNLSFILFHLNVFCFQNIHRSSTTSDTAEDTHATHAVRNLLGSHHWRDTSVKHVAKSRDFRVPYAIRNIAGVHNWKIISIGFTNGALKNDVDCRKEAENFLSRSD